jgi:predicted metal-dependent hydrolase
MDAYDPRYLAGILFFNEHDYFEAHEAWEDLWSESHGAERRFYQGLIQAAVGLFHFSGGNLGGAVKLYRSSYDYMKECGTPFLGLDVEDFWRQMARAFESLLSGGTPDHDLRPDPEVLPVITLDPSPASWPDPEAYIHDD